MKVSRAIIVFLFFSAITLLASRGDAATRCVDPGDAACAATVQGGIDAAATGDIVEVAAGTYFEAPTIPAGKNGLTLKGAGRGKTILDAGGLSNALTVESAGATVMSIGIRNGDNGIVASSDTLTITDVAFQGLHDSCVDVTGNGAIVQATTFNGCADACIRIDGSGAKVIGNQFRHCSDAGTSISGASAQVTGNSYQLVGEAVSLTSSNAQVTGNKISHAFSDGITLNCADCTTALIAKNKIQNLADDSSGIQASANTDGLVIEGNTIKRTMDSAIDVGGDGKSAVRKNKVSSIGGDAYEDCFLDNSPSDWTKNKASICARAGIEVYGDGNILNGNSIAKAFTNGFEIYRNGVTLTGNKAKSNLGAGFVVSDSASGTTLNGNKSSKNRSDLCDEGTLTTSTDNNFVVIGGCGVN